MIGPLFLALLATASFTAPTVLAQVCTGEVTLSSQAEVDAFDCAEVTGSLTISGPDIADLSPVSGLISVGTDPPDDPPEAFLRIEGNPALVSLEGLESLASVGGSLSISHNAALASLAGLDGLTSVGGQINIGSNDMLTSLEGLESLASVGSGFFISGNASLTSLAGLDGLASLEGGLNIEGNAALASLEGLENLTSLEGGLGIENNEALVSLAGLENVTSVGGGLDIEGNASLSSLAGLSSLTGIGGALVILDNDALESLAGLEGLTSISGGTFGSDLLIGDNAALSECACGLGGLITGDPPDFTGVEGKVLIDANAPGGVCTSPEVVLEASTLCVSTASEPTAGVPDRFALSPPYPNPLRGTATVSFAVPVASDVRVVVYDVLGREVAVLADGPAEAGRHEVVFEAGPLPAGAYLVQMTTEAGFAQAQRVTLMR